MKTPCKTLWEGVRLNNYKMRIIRKLISKSRTIRKIRIRIFRENIFG